MARLAWLLVAALTIVVTFLSFALQPSLSRSFSTMPAGFVFPILALIGLVGMLLFLTRADAAKAFLASCLYIIGMLTSVVFGVIPNVLPANSDPQLSLTITNASAPEFGLRVGLMWFVHGILLAAAYFIFLYSRFAGKVSLEGGGH